MAGSSSDRSDRAAQARPRALDLLVPMGFAVAAMIAGFGLVVIVSFGLLGAWYRWVYADGGREERAVETIAGSKKATDGPEILYALPIAALAIGSDGSVSEANDRAERLLDRAIKRQHISNIFRAPVILTAVEAAIEKNIPADLQFKVRRPRAMTLRATVTPLSRDSAKRVLLILQDETDRILVEETRSDFVANASHELRTPVAAISALVETLQGSAKDDPVATDRFLGMIVKQTDRMIRLVNDLLSLSRIEADENIVPTADQDVRKVLIDAIATLQPIAEQFETEIIVSVADSLPLVRGSRDELTQVFVNLIENAIKYAGAKGPVSIVATADARSLSVTVSDNGPGIAPENVTRLTERFFRVDPVDSRTRGGTGLGLAIVKHIVNRHRGSLKIESELGHGTDFIIKIPVNHTAYE